MTETKHGVDASFNDRLNILRWHYLNRWSRYRGCQCDQQSLDHLSLWSLCNSSWCLLYGGW